MKVNGNTVCKGTPARASGYGVSTQLLHAGPLIPKGSRYRSEYTAGAQHYDQIALRAANQKSTANRGRPRYGLRTKIGGHGRRLTAADHAKFAYPRTHKVPV